MATRKEILEDIRARYGNMLNTRQAGDLLGSKNRETIHQVLDGLTIYQIGREKKYFATDIARRLSTLECQHGN